MAGEFEVTGGIRRRAKQLLNTVWLTPLQRILTPIRMFQNRGKRTRLLEIGPGTQRIPEFETLNIVGGRNIDYVADAVSKLPFADGTFDVIYASHVIEHIPWYQIQTVLTAWARKLKPGGTLEVWTPDGLKIAKAFVAAETGESSEFGADDWWRFNEHRDPCTWFSGRIFSYGDGTGSAGHFNWHRSAFSERLLSTLLRQAGLLDVRRLRASEVRGADHGWINLGMKGTRR